VCNYSVTTLSVTQQQAMKNELDAYKRVVTLIHDSSPANTEALLKIIKKSDNLGHAVRDIQETEVRRTQTGGV
jgi:hypothetical protein